MEATQQQTDHFDLLPYIAVLMCMLGCLLFITLSLVSLSLINVGLIFLPHPAPKTPIKVEWAQQGAVMQDLKEPIRWSDQAWLTLESGDTQNLTDQDTPPAFQQLLAKCKGKDAGYYPVFAVRPSGFKTFGAIHDLCARDGIQIGYYPAGEKQRVTLVVDAKAASK